MSDIKYGRKRNGIIKQIKAKLKDWYDSIEDEDVKRLAKRDTIVTGGSIASMLLGEKVNDYDIYFKTKETALAVASYYVSTFYKEAVQNAKMSVRVETIANIKGEQEERVVIFVKSDGVAKADVPESAEGEKAKYHPVYLSQNAITLSDKIQIIIRFYGEPDKIHDNYDFVHAKCYWDNGEEKLVLPAEALEALLSRNLIYRGSLYPIASIFRMKKFLNRGWRITAGQQLKIMWQISEIDLADITVLREQLTGVDMAYMFQLIRELDKEPDKSKIDSAYVCQLIDEIFSGGIEEEEE